MYFTATSRQRGARAWVAGWLWLVAAMVVATVIIGGATRLTDSGLSITEWKPIVGAVPPLSEAAWQEAFLKYQAIPEYQLVNRGITLSQFKIIYWWEWSHRFLARAAGMAFLLPFLAFWLTRRLPRRLVPPLAMVFLLGALQGALGWYMVKSGLASRVDVSPYRLAAHFALAAVVLAAIVWIVLGLGSPGRRIRDAQAWRALALVVLILVQMVIGAFMAGLDAGLATSTWPDMDGEFIPDGLLAMSPWWRNLFENVLAVQFNHRLAAYVIAVFTVLHSGLVYRRGAPSDAVLSAAALLAIVVIQFCLGIATLIAGVPFELALLHQAGALLLLIAAVFHLHLLTLERQLYPAAVRLSQERKFR